MLLTISKELSTKIVEKVNAVKLWAQQHNHKYFVRTDKDIYSNPIYLDNLKSLLPYNYSLNSINRELIDHILDQLSKGTYNVKELSDRFEKFMDSFNFQKTLNVLLIQGLVQCDIDLNPLGPETPCFSLYQVTY